MSRVYKWDVHRPDTADFNVFTFLFQHLEITRVILSNFCDHLKSAILIFKMFQYFCPGFLTVDTLID